MRIGTSYCIPIQSKGDVLWRKTECPACLRERELPLLRGNSISQGAEAKRSTGGADYCRRGSVRLIVAAPKCRKTRPPMSQPSQVSARYTPNLATPAVKLVCRASRKGCSGRRGPQDLAYLEFEAILITPYQSRDICARLWCSKA